MLDVYKLEVREEIAVEASEEVFGTLVDPLRYRN